jgi:hypothetical protein
VSDLAPRETCDPPTRAEAEAAVRVLASMSRVTGPEALIARELAGRIREALRAVERVAES